jgi:predicted nucleic acid-binding protein
MASKIFLDANVILDFALERDHCAITEKVMNAIMDRSFQGFITPAIVHIVDYWLVKRFGKAQSRQLILELLNRIQVIDCQHETTIMALNSRIEDVEDALQYYAALHHRVDYFITLDKKLHKSAIPALPIYFPNEFVKEFLDI